MHNNYDAPLLDREARLIFQQKEEPSELPDQEIETPDSGVESLQPVGVESPLTERGAESQRALAESAKDSDVIGSDTADVGLEEGMERISQGETSEKTTDTESPSSSAPEVDKSEQPKGGFGQAMETITGFFAGAGSKTMEGFKSALEGIGRAYEAFQNFVAQTMAPLLESLEGSESGLAKGLRDFLYMVSGKNRVAFFQQMNAYEVTFQNLEISKFISLYKRRSNEEAHPVPFEKFCAAVMKEFKGKDVAFSDFLKKAEDPQEVPWPGIAQVPEQQPPQAQPPAAPEGTSGNAPQTPAGQAPAEGADGAQQGGQGGGGGASQDV